MGATTARWAWGQMEAGDLRARREARGRRLRRRRALALAALTAAVVAVVVVVATGSAGNSRQAPRDARSAPLRGGSDRRQQRSPASASGGPSRTVPVPILMYHVIATPPAGAPFPGLYVSPKEFAAQMRALKDAGWHAVTLDQVESHWRTGRPLGAGKPIVLTFDNGYQSQYTQALPVLKRLGWVADENMQLSGLPPSQGGLGQAQIRGLVAAGWELDTQGFSHADLIKLGAEQLHYEVAISRSVMQQRYHVPVNWFCYPSGHYDPTVVAAVKAAGYRGSTTVIPGWAHPGEDRYRLHRLRVLGGTTGQGLLGLLAGAREAPSTPASYSGA